jgi:hypothetical protein
MNKKILMLTMTLLTISIMVTPLIGTAQAYRPRGYFITKTLTGRYFVYPEANPPTGDLWGPYATVYEKDDKSIIIWKKLPQQWTGDIAGWGTYSGIWSVISFPTDMKDYGIQVIKDAVVDGIGTGDLVIYASNPALKILWGTGDLRGIKGTGTIVVVPFSMGTIFDYTLEVKIRA